MAGRVDVFAHLSRVGAPVGSARCPGPPTRASTSTSGAGACSTLGAELFARHAYDELSMATIAREAGISKALLYHYFPGKQAYFAATLEEKASELAALTEPDPSLPPLEQLTRSLDAFLDWVEDNREAYGKLVRSAAAIPEVREVVDRVRDATSERILAGIAPGGAAARAAHRRPRVAVVHGRRDPRLGRARRPHARAAAGAAARHAAGRRDRGRRAGRAYSTLSRSITNTSVSFGPIDGGEPCGP